MAASLRIMLTMIGLLAVGVLLTAPAPADAQLRLPPLLAEPPAPPAPPATPAPVPAPAPAPAPATEPAAPAHPSEDAQFAGGAVAPSGRLSRAGDMLIAVRYHRHGPTLHATLSGGCADATIQRTLAMRAGLRFSLRQTSGEDFGDLRITAATTIDGAFTTASASGTASARITVRRRGRVVARCSTGKLSWQMRRVRPTDAAEPASAAAALAGTAYVGRSAQPFTGPFPVAVRVDGEARHVRALFEYRSSCRKRILDPSLIPEVVAGAPIEASGRFARRQTSVVRLPGGLRIRFTARIAGRFTSDGIRGTVEAGFRVTRDGRLLESCRSKGPARFHAVA